jgi:periplasmic protein TonB
MRIASLCLIVVAAIASSASVSSGQEVARVTSPVLVREYKPNYTAEALRRKIEGIVELGAVVLEDGTVGDVVVTKSLDKEYGLDDEAVKTLKKWLFKPGTKDGKPVAVRVAVEMTFTIPKNK